MNQETKVTEIQIIPVKPKDGLIAFASFVLDEKYYIGSVAIYTRLNEAGYRLVYPTKKLGLNNISIFHPITGATGRAIEQVVIGKINELFDENHERAASK